MLLQLCLVFGTLYMMFVWWKNRVYRNIYKQIPCSLPSVPVLGHSVSGMGNAEDLMLKINQLGQDAASNKMGLASIWLTNKFYVIVADPVAADLLMKTCLEKDTMMNLAKPLVGNGIIAAPVSIWRPRRKVLVPTFSQKILNSFVKIFAKQSEIMSDLLESQSGNEKFSIFKYVNTYSMNSVCETVLGVEMNVPSNTNRTLVKAFAEFFNISAFRTVRPWLWSETVFKWMPSYSNFIGSIEILKNFVNKIIKAKRQKIKQQQHNNVENINHNDEKSQTISSLELLIKSLDGKKGYSDLELQEESLVLVLAGTETASVGTSFTIALMAKYPDVQEKVYKEIQQVLGGSDRPIQAEDLPKLKYLDAVIKESLRMYPPVPLVLRTVEKNITLPSGLTLVPGVGIIIHFRAMHRNLKYWGPDVDEFRPERFFDSLPTHPAAYMPFSYGPRMCIGYQYAIMSLKTVIATLVRKYRFLPRIDLKEHETCFQDRKEPFVTKFEVLTRDINNFELRAQIRS